ncbi:LacI family DNA-binding transcriptional regulator [Paenibacillus sp. JCM 10914]|uniref:LacI family DNA-binding transcriptional regulator n=1 Tax=Paenibacillus sp. JCM 10914 TaxID=1236974 RepID=UPI000AD6F684|nr:LacI family DNA-binding transcriptional regulator [Paenibacillus sp. JCM 10914]
MKTKVTIQEIADFTGVSKFAVSRALSGKSGVSPQTRDMILKAAGQLGYFRDQPEANSRVRISSCKSRRTENGPELC